MQVSHNTKFVAYYRVSTQMQGRSGLGLEAQKEAVAHFVKQYGNSPIAEYTEIESGRKDHRPELANALAFAEQEQAVLLIAKLDRLARSVAFITKLIDGKVPFISVDMPDANRMMLQISAVFAEHEARMISERTSAAIRAKIARGESWGTNAASVEKANAYARSLHTDLQRLMGSGITGPAALAKALNERGVRTARGSEWGPGQIVRVLRRIAVE